jgi:glucose-1-phosphate thymidylyltransferase
VPARKGVLLAGGKGTRLFPLTVAVNKHLLPVHDKPMLYYPLSMLMLGGAREIAIVSAREHLPTFERLLGDGARLGVRLTYVEQSAPRGVADGLLAAERFLAGGGCILALGDNLLWGHLDYLREALSHDTGASVFAYPVRDPSRYGVVELDTKGRPMVIEEKPSRPRSSVAIPGLYVLDARAVELARGLKPSPRGELEIADVLRAYLLRGELRVAPLGRGMAWLDMGTPRGLLDASHFVAAIQERQGLCIGCIEEVALRMGFITPHELRATLAAQPPSAYRTYIEGLLHE